MKRKTAHVTAFILLALLLVGCGGNNSTPVSPAPVETPEVQSARQDGERFETVILLEGMEETVRYEHVRNDALGIEMDYDYESLVRDSTPERERFLSSWDDPDAPLNYLEVTYSAEDAETVAAAIREALSEYELRTETRELERAGACICIETAMLLPGGTLADQMQEVYIIPAPDGCRVAAAHFTPESAEGFGRRFSYLMNSLTVIDRAR